MCTSLSLHRNNHYFGRNLDVEFSFKEQVVVTPKNYSFTLRNKKVLTTKYALIGMASVIDNFPLYYEASNTEGLAIAGLNFPKNAVYNDIKENKNNIAPFELIPYLLGLFTTVDEVKEAFKEINITNEQFNKNMPLSPLHFMISDNDKTIVVEQTKEGLFVYDNPYNVMTNNPPFPYHLWNINNYRNLNPKNGENLFTNKTDLNDYAVGMGSIGLPGDTSSSSRFVRAAFNLLNLEETTDDLATITDFFHVLDSVSMVKGSTLTNTNKFDITLYSCCIDTTNNIYYYKLYNNNRINAVKLTDELINKKDITQFNLIKEQDINYQN